VLVPNQTFSKGLCAENCHGGVLRYTGVFCWIFGAYEYLVLFVCGQCNERYGSAVLVVSKEVPSQIKFAFSYFLTFSKKN